MTRVARSVVLVTPNVTVDGGVASHVITSAGLLAAHGAEVTILASDEAGVGVRVVRIAGLTSTGIDDRHIIEFDDTLRSIEPSIVHFHNLDSATLVRSARAVAAVAVSAHGYSGCGPGTYFFSPGHECNRAHGPGCLPNMLLRGCGQTRSPLRMAKVYSYPPRRLDALRLADGAIAYSRAIARHLQRNEVPRVSVVRLATHSVAPSPDPGRRSVLFVGRVVPLKGLMTLVRAMARIEGELEVCGAGWGLEAVRAATRRFSIEDRVRFSGWVAGQDLDQAYRRARVVVVPSHWPEPFGLVGLEAMARGRPVIGSATGGIPDWLEHGRTGLLVAPGDVAELASALAALLDDPDRCSEMGQAGRATTLARFSGDEHVRTLHNAYDVARQHWLSDEGRF